MEKQLITVGLNELATGDREGLGNLFERDRKVYRWVKNVGSTSLVASGSCCVVFTSVEANALKRVIFAGTTATASTTILSCPGGVPVTGIGPSGSDTGDHGWVMVKGVTTVRVYQLATAYVGGEVAIATSVVPATVAWGAAYPATTTYSRYVSIINPVATTGAATYCSAVVEVHCL